MVGNGCNCREFISYAWIHADAVGGRAARRRGERRGGAEQGGGGSVYIASGSARGSARWSGGGGGYTSGAGTAPPAPRRPAPGLLFPLPGSYRSPTRRPARRPAWAEREAEHRRSLARRLPPPPRPPPPRSLLAAYRHARPPPPPPLLHSRRRRRSPAARARERERGARTRGRGGGRREGARAARPTVHRRRFRGAVVEHASSIASVGAVTVKCQVGPASARSGVVPRSGAREIAPPAVDAGGPARVRSERAGSLPLGPGPRAPPAGRRCRSQEAGRGAGRRAIDRARSRSGAGCAGRGTRARSPSRSTASSRGSVSRCRRRPHRPPAPPAPPVKLDPIFLWVRRVEDTVVEVRCEDYDIRNRLRLARTPAGWRVIPRTEIYNTIQIPSSRRPECDGQAADEKKRKSRRKKKKIHKSKRHESESSPPLVPASPTSAARAASPASPADREPDPEPEFGAEPETEQEPWSPPDLETHIPSHTIPIPSRAPCPATADVSLEPPADPTVPLPLPQPLPQQTPERDFNPTPLDNLLAVAELEFNQQQHSKDDRDFALELETDASSLHRQLSKYNFLTEDECERDIMSFDIHDAVKHEGGSDIFFGQKTVEKIQDENPYHANLVVPKDLFESITEGHYLPELVGAHDDTINANELLDSLVEKGCEDNQILDHAFDKLAHLVGHNNTEYHDDEDDMLLHDAPVTDIIDRLEQSMSPGQNSITAAQGLLHLQQISEELAKEQLHSEKLSFNNESFEQTNTHCNLQENTLQIQLEPDDEHEKISEVAKGDPSNNSEVPIDGNILNQQSISQETETPMQGHTEVTTDIQEEPFNSLTDVHTNEALEISQNETHSIGQESVENNAFIDNSELSGDIKDEKDSDSSASVDDMLPTDLSFKQTAPPTAHIIARDAETTEGMTDNMSEKSDELPKDLSCHKRMVTPSSSPKRQEIPRPPSRESDAMQSPQPSGIPAIPSSPELFTAPYAKSNKSLFLETLLASPSPKMCFSSELTITKHQSEPLNLGKHRKSASPTVSSCSDEIKKMQKEYGEPEEKRIKKESAEAQAKVNKILSKTNEEIVENKHKKVERPPHKGSDELSPLKQLQILKLSNDFTVPDPLLVPKEKLNDIIISPGREIPALLLQRPELRLPEAFAFPAILQDPDILVISLSQLENILENKLRKQDNDSSHKQKETKTPSTGKSASSTESAKTVPPEGPPKQIPSMEALAGDIDAATSAALNQMLWLPYLSQLEAAVACSQNADFLKALNTSGYSSHGAYPDLAQMFAPSSRFMNPTGFPMMSQMDYNNQLELAMWQEAMNQTSNAVSQRASKQNSAENQLKELAKAVDAQNPYLHSPKNLPSRSHSAARTSPIAHNYNLNCQRNAMNHANQFFPGMYPGMNANIRPNVPLPGLQIPHFNPNLMAAQRSSRGQHQQKSPTSPYFHNNNYLQSLKQSSNSRVPQSPTQKRSAHGGGSQESGRDARAHPTQSRPPSHSSTAQAAAEDGQKPRISVKSLQNLLEPSQVAAHQNKRMDYQPYHPPSLSDLMAKPSLSHAPPHDASAASAAAAAAAAASHSAMKMRRQMLDASLQRRMLGHDEGEVGSTTTHEDAAAMPLHHDPQTHLWHPLFGNQKGYNSPWNWTTVTVNGE